MAFRQIEENDAAPGALSSGPSGLSSPGSSSSLSSGPSSGWGSRSGSGSGSGLAAEQEYVTMLYGLLDAARSATEARLREVRAAGGAGGTRQARLERDVSAAEHESRLSALSGVERGLCFGRTDDEAGDTLYIGRTGLRDHDYELKLIDWRAPAARPFYAATPRDPVGLVRRRHIYTRQRTVTGVDDEVFDLDQLSDSDKATLSGEAALIAAVSSARTGRMSDVVATIQAEQDRVIRSALPGVLVVQGGPGTGKTVAALHRAAYLLYTHRRTLAKRGVLVIGPNATFLRYIGQVLPSLGETDVVLHTLGDLFPGVRASETRDPAAVVKGSLRMVSVLRQAVRDRQRVPASDLVVCADGVDIPLPKDVVRAARDRARSLRKPHNVARKLFVTELLTWMAYAEARVLDRPFEDEDVPYARERLWDEPEVVRVLDGLWPLLTPERALGDLLGSARAIASASRQVLSDAERAILARPVPGGSGAEFSAAGFSGGSAAGRSGGSAGWTVADVPLLDELAELLGVDNSDARRRRREMERAQKLEAKYAAEVLEITDVADLGLVDAETLAAWNRDNGPALTTAERAASDRSWAYGHVIIDEAQELSEMAWRMVLRRNPSVSMTVVGDTAQTGSPAGARSWTSMLDQFVRGRWRAERLTVNYRTPSEIMAVAADVLASAAPGERPPESVRTEGVPPRAIRVPVLASPGPGPVRSGPALPGPALPGPALPGPAPSGTVPSGTVPAGTAGAKGAPPVPEISVMPESLAREAARVARADLDEIGGADGGRLAVIAPDALIAPIGAALPEAIGGDAPESLDAAAALLTVSQAKGLEFDRVVLADPAGIIAQSPNGGHDLYVAITRATHRLTVVFAGDLPAPLRGLGILEP